MNLNFCIVCSLISCPEIYLKCSLISCFFPVIKDGQCTINFQLIETKNCTPTIWIQLHELHWKFDFSRSDIIVWSIHNLIHIALDSYISNNLGTNWIVIGLLKKDSKALLYTFV